MTNQGTDFPSKQVNIVPTAFTYITVNIVCAQLCQEFL